MVRLAVNENLNDLRGHLTAGFAATALQGRFLMELAPEQRAHGTGLLRDFARAGAVVQEHESAFNSAARDEGGLLRHLRSGEHFAALKNFRAIGDELIGLSSLAGGALVDQAKQNVSRVIDRPVAAGHAPRAEGAGRPAVQKF